MTAFDFTPPVNAPSYALHLPEVRIHYRLIGQGPPLILLHGLGSSGADWYPIVQGLADHFQLVLIDLRGFGSSSLARNKDYRIASMAHDVSQVMAALEMGTAHVVGLSLGGCVALQMAATRPAQVDHLVLVNTFAKLRAGKGAGCRWQVVGGASTCHLPLATCDGGFLAFATRSL